MKKVQSLGVDLNSTEQLESLYLQCKDLYETDGTSPLTDAEFDELERELKRRGSSVTQVVGGGNSSVLKYKHMSPMLSLEKIQVNDEGNFPFADINAFCKGKYPVEATSKFDGVAIELRYDFGSLQQALTRGKDGRGADVTRFLKMIVPNSIPRFETYEIRGEIVMPLDKFAKYNSTKNVRNFVAGVISPSRTDTSPALKDLVFVAYSVKTHSKDRYSYVGDAQDFLSHLGFNKEFPVKVDTIKSPADIRRVYDVFKEYRGKSQFQLDGIVLKAPESMRSDLGYTNHHPRWAVAIKFPSTEVVTTILNFGEHCFDWSVGRTGELAPTALLAPVELDGSTVQRASVYNKEKIVELGVFPGAVVSIKKSGDIIPMIVSVLKRSPREAEYVSRQSFFPTHCPACGVKLDIYTDTKKTKGDIQRVTHIVCENARCIGKAARNLSYATTAMQLKGIGESTAELLVKAGIRTAADLFDQTKMSPAKLVASGYFKQGRELEKIFEGIKATKRVDLDAVIRSLGINGLGRTISKQLANYLAGNSHSFSGLEMEVVGPFLNESSRERKLLEDMMQKMRSSGVEVIYPKEVVTTANTIFYEMTGKTEGTGYKTKDELKEFLKSKGYIHSKIGEASLLLTDSYNSDSSKMSIARKKNIKIKTYRDLLEELA